MANSVGGKIRTVMVGIIIGLLVIGFALWGVNDVFTPSNPNAVMSVGDTDVSINEFNEAFRNELQTMAQDSGQGLTDSEAYSRGVHNKVLQGLMTDAIIEADANDLGIGVNRKSARNVVKEIDAFKDELTGQFSEDKMMEILSRNRITRKKFENDIYKSLRRQQTVPGIIGGIDAPSEFGALRYKFLTEQRKARVLTITERAVDAPADPDDDTLKAFIDKNEGRYTAPEYRRFTMIRIETNDVTPDLTVTEEEIKAAYDYKLELGELGTFETRSLVQITADSEANAKAAADRLAAGEAAEDVATSLGLISPQIYTDVVKDGIIDPVTAEAAFEMEEGTPRVLEGSLGFWYAVALTGITPAEAPDYEANKAGITEDLQKAKAEEKIYDITGEIEDALTDGASLEELAENSGISLTSFDYIDRRGLTRDGKSMSGFSAIPGVAEDDEILKEIFVNDLEYTTDLFQTSTGGWASIRTDDIIDTARRPFEEVKDIATAAWKTEQINEALDAKILELGNAAKDGKTLDALAAEIQNGSSIDDFIIVRSSPGDNIGPRVTVDLLDSEVGDYARGPGPKPLTRQIAKLTQIVSNQDGLAGRFEDVMKTQINDAIANDIQQAYQAAIFKEHPLREYPDKVRTTLGVTE